MKKEDVCGLVECLGEVFIGGAIGIITRRTILPKCDKGEKIIVALGSMIIGGMIGRSFYKGFYKACDEIVGTDFCEENDL
jgi:hypothetical protein